MSETWKKQQAEYDQYFLDMCDAANRYPELYKKIPERYFEPNVINIISLTDSQKLQIKYSIFVLHAL